MPLPRLRLIRAAWLALLGIALASACTTVTDKCDNCVGDDPTSDFDLDARIAEISANNGIYVIVSIASGDVLLQFSDSDHLLYGAAVSIPGDELSGLPRALLSIEPHLGAALSLALGQSIVGPVFNVEFVNADTGDPLTLARPRATITAPYDEANFSAGFTETAIFVGAQFVEFASGLTSVGGRQISPDNNRVSGRGSKFGRFVAFHDDDAAGGSGSGNDDDNNLPPDVDASESIQVVMNNNAGSSCTVNGGVAALPVARAFEYTLSGTDSSTLLFRATGAGNVNFISYRLYLSGPHLSLPTGSTATDPGFPTLVTGYAFAINCVDGNSLSALNSNTGITAGTDFTALGVLQRSVQISDWFTNGEPISTTCAGIDCDVHSGFVRVKFNPLEITDQTNTILEGRFSIDTYMSGAIWEVPK